MDAADFFYNIFAGINEHASHHRAGRSSSSTDACNPRGETGALSASWVGTGYQMRVEGRWSTGIAKLKIGSRLKSKVGTRSHSRSWMIVNDMISRVTGCRGERAARPLRMASWARPNDQSDNWGRHGRPSARERLSQSARTRHNHSGSTLG
ncbi:hypothetical protein EVAR_76256_1 [Eumeta japonica]|uniref:Uncharacterized protein n=1 Tax=Eumeta variegata TaxID=151549 RepID=A0A4C1UNX7_EUMVA|nr:hypothetical protein EVAR_76256_1 [Eumeta japonica]